MTYQSTVALFAPSPPQCFSPPAVTISIQLGELSLRVVFQADWLILLVKSEPRC